jgi:hypothetical protein
MSEFYGIHDVVDHCIRNLPRPLSLTRVQEDELEDLLDEVAIDAYLF